MANLSNINNVLRISSDLRVGINTDAASYALEIGGTNSGIKLKNSGGSGKVYSLLSDTSGNFQIYDDAATSGRLVIASGGDATFAGGLRVRGGASTPIAGEARLGGHASHGAQLYGQGTSTDLIFYNKNGSTVMSVATGTINTTLAGWLSSTSSSFRMSFNVGDGDTFMSINHSGNEAWAFKCESIGGSLDAVTIGTTGGTTEFDENGQIFSHQKLDVATAGGRLTGKSNRGYLASIHLEQVATNTDGGEIYFMTAPSGTTAGEQRMTITEGGNVGIGTTNPSGVKFQSVQTTSGEWTGDFKNYTANGYGLRVDMSGSSSVQAALQVYTGSGTGFVVKNSGNVGIGTFTPTGYKLVIQNTSEDMLKLHNSTDGLDSLISFTNPGGTLGRIQGLDNGGLQFDTGNNAGGLNTDVMVMSSGGKVGIGTTGPATKLTVKGATQFGGNSTSTAALTSEFSAYGTTQNLYSITLQEGAVWSPGIAVINFAASRSGLQKHYAGQIIVRLTYYNLSGVAGQGGWAAPSAVGAVVAYSGQAETYMRVYVNGSNTGNPQTIQIGVRDIDDTTNYFVSDIRVTLRSGALTITS